MPLHRWLQLQLIYLGLAIGFNIVSIGLEQLTGRSLILGSQPLQSIGLLVVLLTPTLWLGFKHYYVPYAVINFALALLLLRIGVLKHVYAYSANELSLYVSIFAWGAAITVNTFGVCMAVGGSARALVEWRRLSGKP